MYIIQSNDSESFLLDGVKYYRNFESKPVGQNLIVFGVYDNRHVLIPYTNYSEFTVNGATFNSAIALQAALVNVIYFRYGGGVTMQDNKRIVKTFKYFATWSEQDILNRINTLETYTVSDTESVWFFGSLVTPTNQITPYIRRYAMFNKGKGTYGIGGTQLTGADVRFISQDVAGEEDIINAEGTQNIPYVLAENQNISQWLNTQNPAITVQPIEDGYRVFTGSQGTYFFLADGGLYGVGNLQSTIQDFELFGDELPAPPVNTVTGYNVDNSDPQNPVIVEHKDLPDGFFVASSALTTTIEARGRLNYITDVPRFIDLRPYVNNYVLNGTNEVVRDRNNIFTLGRAQIPNTTSLQPFIVRTETRIVNNILKVINSNYALINTGLDGDNSLSRIHSSFYSNGFIYAATRPDPQTIPNKVFKINANNLEDIKTFTFPESENLRNINEIKVYKDGIFIMCQSLSPENSVKLIRLDTDFGGYEVLKTFPYSGVIALKDNTVFNIYHDKIYVTYYPNPVANANRYLGLLELDLSGNILRQSEAFDLGASTTILFPHWCTIFNGKFIVHCSLSNNANRKLVRIDIPTMSLDEFIALPQGFTDDNTMMPNGDIYLNGEGSNTGGLYKVYYKDFSTLQLVTTPWRSSGGVQYYYEFESLKAIPAIDNTGVLRSLKVEITQTGDTIQNDALIGADVHYIVARNAVQNTDFIFNNGTGVISNYYVEAGEIHYINYIKP